MLDTTTHLISLYSPHYLGTSSVINHNPSFLRSTKMAPGGELTDLSSPTSDFPLSSNSPVSDQSSSGPTGPGAYRMTHDALSSTTETRIVYHVDDEQTPYLVKLPIPHNSIKLYDFKTAISLPRPHYKFFFKSYDKDFDGIVKEEIVDDNSLLPIFKGRVVAYLVSTEGSTISDSTNSQCPTEISAAERLPANGLSERHHQAGMVGSDAHPLSFHATDHCGDTTTETESMISSRHGSKYQNSRNRVYGSKAGYVSKYGARYSHRNGHHHHAHHHHYMDSSVITSDMESTSFVDSDDDDDDEFLDTGADDDYDDYGSRISTTTEETSVSRQYARRRRRRHKNYRNEMSRTSSLSSITESSMTLNAIQVTLNLDTVNYLGISLVGQTSKNGDGGIYVSSIMQGGAVDLDGRIEPGDMILQVNDISFENLSNDQAVEVIRDAVKNLGPIKLIVAKCWDFHPKGHFTIPRSEPVRPIDPGAWVAHTEAARAKFTNPDNFPLPTAPFINSSTFPDSTARTTFQTSHSVPPSVTSFANSTHSYPMSNSGMTESNQLMSGSPLRNSFKVGQNVTIAPNPTTATIHVPPTLTVETSLDTIAYAMASPNSGLDVHDRMWLKIPIPNAFIGSDVVEWLYSMVQGFHERKDAKKFASRLLKEGFICHTVNLKNSFSEKCYYVFSEQLQKLNKSLPETDEFALSGFEENFNSVLRLTNDNFQSAIDTVAVDQTTSLTNQHFKPANYPPNVDAPLGHVSLPNPTNQSKLGKYKVPFMHYWDESSEIRNYGLFGPQDCTTTQSAFNDGTSSNHSGGGRHDSYQSDEQVSQQSGQSILYNPQAPGPTPPGRNTNTIRSGSTGSGKTSNSNPQANFAPSFNGSSNHGTNGNTFNHHYEDLQINPSTGNLVPSSQVQVPVSQHVTGNGFYSTASYEESSVKPNDLVSRNGGSSVGSGEGESGAGSTHVFLNDQHYSEPVDSHHDD